MSETFFTIMDTMGNKRRIGAKRTTEKKIVSKHSGNEMKGTTAGAGQRRCSMCKKATWRRKKGVEKRGIKTSRVRALVIAGLAIIRPWFLITGPHLTL